MGDEEEPSTPTPSGRLNGIDRGGNGDDRDDINNLKKGAWEWETDLAPLRRAEAESAFQAMLREAETEEGRSRLRSEQNAVFSSAPLGCSEDDDNGSFIDNGNDTSATSISSNGNVGRRNIPRRNRFVPPPKRPRKTRREYRISALEPDHDEKLIPSLQIEDVAAALPSAVERERLHEDAVLPLLGKRMWKYRGLDYEEAHPCEAGLKPTPDGWAEDGDDNEHGRPWPLGTQYDASAIALCWAFFRFVFAKNRGWSIIVVACEVIVSLTLPACSYLFGTGLLDELNEKTARGQDERTRIINASFYATAILILRIFAAYLTVYYSNQIPVGGARTGLRDTLFSRMQNLKSPLKDKLTPGAASGIIVDEVHYAVDIYYSFLTFPSLITGALGNVAVSFSSIIKIQYTHLVSLPTIIVVVMAIVVPILVNMWYQPEYCILTRLEHQWVLRLRSLAGSAIPRAGRSYKSPTSTTDSLRGSGGGNELRQIFHETAFLVFQRHWQSWKLSVVIVFLLKILSQIGIAIVTITAGYAVIAGRGVTVGNFSTLIASVAGIVAIGNDIGSFLTGLYENHMMLKQISCIMNDEDVGFDGGLEHFESVKKELEQKGHLVVGQVKNTGKKAVEVGKHAVEGAGHVHVHKQSREMVS